MLNKAIVYLLALIHFIIIASIPFQIWYGITDETFPLWAKISLLSLGLRAMSSSILCPLTELEIKLRAKANMPALDKYPEYYIKLAQTWIINNYRYPGEE